MFDCCLINQVVHTHTHLPLSPNCIIGYWTKGDDAVRHGSGITLAVDHRLTSCPPTGSVASEGNEHSLHSCKYHDRLYDFSLIVTLTWLDDRVLDHDTYSAHDAIGRVYIDLNPLLIKRKDNIISGWYPIYDTMHGTVSSSVYYAQRQQYRL